jgi:hypothetical protein
MEVVNIEGDGYKYLGVDTATKDIKIYNTDHSLWKTIHTNIPAIGSKSVKSGTKVKQILAPAKSDFYDTPIFRVSYPKKEGIIPILFC